ncbi:MAG: adenylate/guanylate cyclase domain-containing protein, partial [Oleibacter sp.]|nr:adenylate/guanylate cyclase domain-containing protein [Thalassolituus sp.]
MIRRLFEHIERLNTSQRAGLVSSSLVLLAGLIISLLTYNHLRTVNSELTEQNIQRDLNHLGTLLTPSLLRNDRLSLKLLLDEWDLDAGITAVRLTNNDGATLASRGEINDNSSVIQSDIIQDNKRFGTLLVSTSSEPAVTMANRFASLSIMLTAALTLIAGLAGWLLAESHRRYLKRLTIKLEEWKAGENLQMPTVPSNPDLFSMHTSLSDIARKEQQRLAVENALSQFMGTSSEPHNTDPMRYYECAILFIEIQDLNELQHRLSAEALTSTLNQYHRLLSQAAKLYNGKVDRFLGDGVVMLFGIPHKDTNASMHCLYAARLFTGLVEHMR